MLPVQIERAMPDLYPAEPVPQARCPFSDSLRQHVRAAIDGNRLAGDEGAGVGAEEFEGAAEVVGGGEAAHGDAGDAHGDDGVGGDGVGGGGVGEAGGDRVDPDAVGAELAGEDLGERDRRGIFGSDIPHGDRLANAAKVLHERTDLKDDVKRKMLLDNVARFYKMPVE